MLVLLTERVFFLDRLGQVSGLERGYLEFFSKMGVQTISFSPWTNSAKEILDRHPVTHIVFTGGNDVSPEVYKENPDKPSDYSMDRDRFEMDLLKEAAERKIPALGICRGMQLMNVYNGGKLVQDLHAHLGFDGHPPRINHTVKVVDEKLKEKISRSEFSVNSFHCQAVTVKKMSSELKASLIAENEIVEGFYHPTLPMAGIQWHPERMGAPNDVDKVLIESFLKKELYWGK